MRTHVFIVNNDTFPVHLQYLFAGTGAYSQSKKEWVDEHNGLLSDIKRVRPGDLVIFYMEATMKVKGGFYGIFKIAEQNPMVFHTPGISGFQPNLPKHKLIYRTLLEPYEVYSKGVPEWEALDKLPVYATEMQWSLIYRKLKGKRGCTPLLPWESQRLIDMIRNKNSGNVKANAKFTGNFDWDKSRREIKIIDTQPQQHYPQSRSFNFDALTSLWKFISKTKTTRKKEGELLLQLYFTENIGSDPNLNSIIGDSLLWFGNEVACGVGMQKIDILTICQNNEKREYRIIELKCQPIKPDIVDQVDYYVNWTSQDSGRHLDGAYHWNIQPIVIAPPHKHRNWQSVVNVFRKYNQKQISLPILYFEFQVQRPQSINFQEVNY